MLDFKKSPSSCLFSTRKTRNFCYLISASFSDQKKGLSDYARQIEYYAFGRHPWNQGIVLKIMLGWR